MPARSEVSYFGAGPAPLPTKVLEDGAKAFVNFEDSGLSLAEISHRSPTANKILADTRQALISLLDIPDNYEVLFMHGGGSAEFSAVVFNLVAVWIEKRRLMAEKEFGDDQAAILRKVEQEVRHEMRLDYLVTGSWSLKASQEAANLLEPLTRNAVNVVTDARENGGKFGSIPAEREWGLSPSNKSAFIYYCDNETVDGVEFPGFPCGVESQPGEEERLVVADMSSNFLSRPVDVKKHAVIFGGAQKNIGITDVTLVIVRKDLLTTVPNPSFLHQVGMFSPPVVLNWPVIAKNNSLYNTMPIFSIWIAREVMRGLIAFHGASKLKGQEAVSNAKADTIYRILDSNPEVYQPVNDRNARSRMNICFRVGDSETEEDFLDGAKKLHLLGLNGHRSVGGVRASNYNAVPMENVQKLANYMIDFAQRKR